LIGLGARKRGIISKVKTAAAEFRIGSMTVLKGCFEINIGIVGERIYGEMTNIDGTFHRNTVLRISYWCHLFRVWSIT